MRQVSLRNVFLSFLHHGCCFYQLQSVFINGVQISDVFTNFHRLILVVFVNTPLIKLYVSETFRFCYEYKGNTEGLQARDYIPLL